MKKLKLTKAMLYALTIGALCSFLPTTLLASAPSSQPSSSYINKWTIGGTLFALGAAIGGYCWWKSTRTPQSERKDRRSSRTSNTVPTAASAPTADPSVLASLANISERLSILENENAKLQQKMAHLLAARQAGSPLSLLRLPVDSDPKSIMQRFLNSSHFALPQPKPIRNYVTLTELPGYKGSEYTVESFTQACKNNDLETLNTMFKNNLCLYQEGTYKTEIRKDGTKRYIEISASSQGPVSVADSNGNILEAIVAQHAKSEDIFELLRLSALSATNSAGIWRIIKTKNKDLQTPFWLGCSVGNVQLLEYVKRKIVAGYREYKFDDVQQDKNGDTPLHIAIKNNHTDIVESWTGGRGPVSIDRLKGGHYAQSYVECFSTMNNDGQTPFELAASKRNARMFEALLPHAPQYALTNLQRKYQSHLLGQSQPTLSDIRTDNDKKDDTD